MVELFREGKDLEAAERGFLQIFKEHEKPLREKLMRKFLYSFKNEYDRGKAQFNAPGKSHETLKADIGFHIISASHFMEAVFKGKIDKNSEAEFLGRALGIILAMFEYGIIKLEPDQELYDHILKLAYQWAYTLKSVNKSITLRFIEDRIETIAKKNVGQITRRHEQLLARVAAIFHS